MNGSGFQALVAQLGELSEVQRKALLTALKRKSPGRRGRRTDRHTFQGGAMLRALWLDVGRRLEFPERFGSAIAVKTAARPSTH